MKRQNILFIITGLLLLLGSSSFIYIHNRTPEVINSSAGYFICPIRQGNDMRCLEEGVGGCYGRYALRGPEIKDGIDPTSPGAATCEGLITNTEYLFAKNGDYITTHHSEDN